MSGRRWHCCVSSWWFGFALLWLCSGRGYCNPNISATAYVGGNGQNGASSSITVSNPRNELLHIVGIETFSNGEVHEIDDSRSDYSFQEVWPSAAVSNVTTWLSVSVSEPSGASIGWQGGAIGAAWGNQAIVSLVDVGPGPSAATGIGAVSIVQNSATSVNFTGTISTNANTWINSVQFQWGDGSTYNYATGGTFSAAGPVSVDLSQISVPVTTTETTVILSVTGSDGVVHVGPTLQVTQQSSSPGTAPGAPGGNLPGYTPSNSVPSDAPSWLQWLLAEMGNLVRWLVVPSAATVATLESDVHAITTAGPLALGASIQSLVAHPAAAPAQDAPASVVWTVDGSSTQVAAPFSLMSLSSGWAPQVRRIFALAFWFLVAVAIVKWLKGSIEV